MTHTTRPTLRHPRTSALSLAFAAVALLTPATLLADGPRTTRTKEIRVEPTRGETIHVERIQVVPEIDVDVWTSKGQNARYCVGEEIEISFRTNADAYVAIFDTDTRGETHRIFPNRYDREHFVRAGEVYDLPARGYRFRIEGPPGHETLHVVAAESRAALRRAVDDLVYGRAYPATYGSSRSDRYPARARSVRSGYEAKDHRSAGVRTAGPQKIAVVADDVAYATLSHRVRDGRSCHARIRPSYRPWWR